jgi:hypothetical protein
MVPAGSGHPRRTFRRSFTWCNQNRVTRGSPKSCCGFQKVAQNRRFCKWPFCAKTRQKPRVHCMEENVPRHVLPLSHAWEERGAASFPFKTRETWISAGEADFSRACKKTHVRPCARVKTRTVPAGSGHPRRDFWCSFTWCNQNRAPLGSPKIYVGFQLRTQNRRF